MYRYHGRANSIRHYNNPQNPVNPDSNLFVHWKYDMETYREKNARHHVASKTAPFIPKNNSDIISTGT